MSPPPRKTLPDELNSFTNRSFLVGIGASAGGLQALEAFFSSLPVDPGATFVVVQHLSPDFRSLMVELLQRRTHMPVCVIEDEMVLRLNRVHVLPPGMMVSLRGQQLFLEERQGGAIDYPIDQFFLSLAQERADRTIGILLSGTGHDGTEGLKSISRGGGIALVQSQDTAQFGAMPSNPISSGLVDEILSPEELAKAVCDIIRYTDTQAALSSNAEPLLPAHQLTQILDILKEQENVDFSQYKIGTLHRRIVHRMLLSKANTVDQYLDFLADSSEEVKNLRQDLLIGSTRFFRDPAVWDFLKSDILPALLETLNANQPLRLWVSACSTGEEVYTLAMVVHEVRKQMQRTNPVKIFATDIDQEALLFASHGLYPSSIDRDIGLDRLANFFVKEGICYRVKKFIRSQVVFASQDLTRNPGFSQMHLVSCRNLFIYLQPSMQEQVLRLLHFSLAPHGVLILGSSEHLGNLSSVFNVLNQPLKIFQKRRGVQLPMNRSVPIPAVSNITTIRRPLLSQRASYEYLISDILKLRFGDLLVTCLLVDQDYQILHVFINTARLLEFPLGEVDINVLGVVPAPIRIPLSTALHRAKRDKKPVLYSAIQVAEFAANQRLNLWVTNIKQPGNDPSEKLIILLEIETRTESIEETIEETIDVDVDYEPNSALSQQLKEVEFELQQTRENLQTSIEELETSNEEQQATNEELLAANEELQSTNEELQSVNEELYTVNTENQERIAQLTELSADVDNLLQSIEIGVVFLDQNLNIRKFTSAATKIFKFRVGDIGRPLSELVNHLNLSTKDLMGLVRAVTTSGVIEEIEVVDLKTQDQFLLRILPYRREDETTDGVVLTFIVVNELKAIQRELTQSHHLLEELYSNSPFGLCMLDAEMRFVRLNKTLAEINGLTIDEHIGKTIREILPDLHEIVHPHFVEVMTTGQPFTFEIEGTTPARPGVLRSWLACYYPVKLNNDKSGVGGIIVEITEQKQIQSELKASQEMVQKIADISPAILTLFELPTGKVTYANSAIKHQLGYSPEEIYQYGDEILARFFHPDDRVLVQAHFVQLSQAPTGEILEYDYRVRHRDGSWHWIYQRDVVFSRDQSGAVKQVLGVGTDITERVQGRAELQRNEVLLRTALQITPTTLFTVDSDLRYTWISNPIADFLQEEMLGYHDRDFFPTVVVEELTRLKQQVLDTGKGLHNYEFRLDTNDSTRIFELHLTARHDSVGNVVGLTGAFIDITHRKQNDTKLQQLTQRLEQAQQVAEIGDWNYDLRLNELTWSAQVFRILNMDPASDKALTIPEILSLIHPDDRVMVTNLCDLDSTEQESLNVDVRVNIKNQVDRQIEDTRTLNIIGYGIRDGAGKMIQMFGTVMDITTRKQTEHQLKRQAFFDSLTQLPNRTFFLQNLRLAMQRFDGEPSNCFAVLYLDLDGFKDINDTLGHAAGDAVLIEIGRRLESVLRSGDIACRLGGDEFAVLLVKTDHPEVALEVAHRVRKSISQPIILANNTHKTITTSIGIAFYDPDAPWNSETSTLENADIAMYQGKRTGSSNIRLFDPSMRSECMVKAEITDSVTLGLEQKQFLLYYQPLIDLCQQKLMGFEALIRWKKPKQGILSPMMFLPSIQSSQLMIALESWILKQACIQCREWNDQHKDKLGESFRININVSANFLKSPTFIDKLHEALEISAVNPHMICLEITENAFIDKASNIDNLLKSVKKLGIQIALDDFGTGYSSLSYLHRLPIDIVKIDQSFVQSLDTDSSLRDITEGIISLVHRLGLSVIAEGIETKEQFTLIRDLSCTYGQGYLFSHPLSPKVAEQFINNRSKFEL